MVEKKPESGDVPTGVMQSTRKRKVPEREYDKVESACF